jgi:hypothetical protein
LQEAENTMGDVNYINKVLDAQDLEKIRFSQGLRRNMGDYNQLVEGRVDEMTNEAYERKRTAFQKAHIDLGRYMDMDHNAGYYNSRNQDVDNLLGLIDGNNKRILNQAGYDKDISKRQFEINDYFYHNKLETLFFLQLFFISVLAMGGVIYAGRAGMITPKMAGLLTMLLVAIVVVTGVTRYFYTSRTRDQRLWHRRFFPKEAPASTVALKCPCPTAQYADLIKNVSDSALKLPDGMTKNQLIAKLKCEGGTVPEFDLNRIIPRGVTQCGDEARVKINNWSKSFEDELTAYQTLGTPPKKIASAGDMCSYKPDWSM